MSGAEFSLVVMLAMGTESPPTAPHDVPFPTFAQCSERCTLPLASK